MHRAWASVGLLALWGSAPADAQMICRSHTMTAGDYRAMKAEAHRVAQGHELKVSSVCMNPGRGHVWLDAQAEPQADGSEIRLAALCTRDPRPWKCELIRSRFFQFTLPLAGIGQTFHLQIPPQMDVADVRALATAAFEKGGSLSALDACGRPPDLADPKENEALDRDLRTTFSPGGTAFEGRIEDADGGMALSNDFYSLEFHRAIPGGEWQFSCWWAVVIIT